jgi:hypothetical protein
MDCGMCDGIVKYFGRLYGVTPKGPTHARDCEKLGVMGGPI